MIHGSIPDTSAYQYCAHCGARNCNWLWRRIECYPKPTYEILCVHCIKHQESTFLIENVLHQAQGIISFHQAVLSGRVVRAEGGK